MSSLNEIFQTFENCEKILSNTSIKDQNSSLISDKVECIKNYEKLIKMYDVCINGYLKMNNNKLNNVFQTSKNHQKFCIERIKQISSHTQISPISPPTGPISPVQVKSGVPPFVTPKLTTNISKLPTAPQQPFPNPFKIPQTHSPLLVTPKEIPLKGIALLDKLISILPPTPPQQEYVKRLKNIENNILEMIVNEMKICDPTVVGKPSFDDVIGMEKAKNMLEEMVIYPLLRPELFTGLRTPPKGLLLFGPPGTGKTILVRALSNHAKCRFFSLSASSLVSKWVGEGEKLVRALFVVAGAVQPSIIFIDEIDSLLSARGDHENESSRRMKTEFLVQLDGTGGTATDGGVVFIGATNRPGDLDDAVLRRMPRRIYLALPDLEGRIKLVKHTLGSTKVDMKESEFKEIGKRTNLFSNADIVLLCKDACMFPIRELIGTTRPSSAKREKEEEDDDDDEGIKKKKKKNQKQKVKASPKTIPINPPPYTPSMPTPMSLPSPNINIVGMDHGTPMAPPSPSSHLTFFNVSPESIRPVIFADFEKAFKNVRPSVNESSLKDFEKWNKKFGSE